MRGFALIAVLALTGCKTCPEPLPQLPDVVEVVVDKIVPVPAELTQDCQRPAKQGNTYGEAIRLANARDAALVECTRRIRQIRALDANPAGQDQ